MARVRFGAASYTTTSEADRWIVRLTSNATSSIDSVADVSGLLDTGGVTFNVQHGLGLPGMVLVASADGYVTGIEPATNLPNPRSAETQAGRVIDLPAGETWSAGFTVDWLTGPKEVQAVRDAISELRG